MKIHLLVAAFLSFSLIGTAQSPDWLWAVSASGINDDFVESLAVDASGNRFLTGSFESATITFGTYTLTNSGESDMFIVKYDAAGNVVWAKSAGGIYADEGFSVATDAAGNCFVVGYYWSTSIIFDTDTLFNSLGHDVFVVKYDPSGNVIWTRGTTGSFDNQAVSVAVDNSGNCYVAGFFKTLFLYFGSDTLTNAASNSPDMFIVKYDVGGNALWAKSAGSIGYEEARSIAVDSDGNSYVTGYFESSNISFGATTLTNANPGSRDVFVVKYDTAGNVLWASSAGGNSIDDGRGIGVDGFGNSYITGTFISPSITFGTTTLTNAGANEDDLFLVKFDSIGNVVWAKSAGGTLDDPVRSMAVDAAGNCYITGYFKNTTLNFNTVTLTNTVSGEDDIYIAKYDANGNVIWAKSVGGVNSDRSHAIASDASGYLTVAGYFTSPTISFGASTLTNSGTGTYDLFISKLDNVTRTEVLPNEESFSIFPNPAGTNLIIQSSVEINEVKVFDCVGRQIFNSQLSRPTTSFRLSTVNYSAGIYFVEIISSNKKETVKFVRE